jgi:hypothetical protein
VAAASSEYAEETEDDDDERWLRTFDGTLVVWRLWTP